MGGGGSSAIGKSEGTQRTYSPAAGTLANLAERLFNQTGGIRSGLIDAMQEVLQTGGSTIPIISRAVERTRSEASKAQTQTEEELAQQGLAGTPFGEMIKATQAQQGNIAAGQTEQSLAQNIFNQIANFVLGQGQTAFSGLQGAIPGMGRTDTTSTGKSHAVAGGYNYKGGTTSPYGQ
jgi:hypothetical protein